MVFDEEFKKVIVGRSNDDEIIKFPCGKREVVDCEGAASIEDAARRCALRELAAETDPSVVDSLMFFHKIDFERRFEKRISGGGALPLIQFHFVGVVNKRINFWSLPIEKREMGVPEWWTPFDVLRLDRVTATRVNPHHGNVETIKVNPFHQIALVRCLRELREKLGENASAMSGVFANLIRIPMDENLARAIGLKSPFTDFFDYEGVVRSLIKARLL